MKSGLASALEMGFDCRSLEGNIEDEVACQRSTRQRKALKTEMKVREEGESNEDSVGERCAVA